MKIQIAKEEREFKFEESLRIFEEETEKSVIAYFLSDVILLTERDGLTNRLFKYVEINELSFAKNVPDLKYFSYLFAIKGADKTITIICDSRENKRVLMA